MHFISTVQFIFKSITGVGIEKKNCHTSLSYLFQLVSTDDHKFSEAIAILFTWIDRGEVNRRTANHFYSMIQSANSHVRRLMSEKAQHEEELERAKEAFKNALLAILNQCKDAFIFYTLKDVLKKLPDKGRLT